MSSAVELAEARFGAPIRVLVGLLKMSLLSDYPAVDKMMFGDRHFVVAALVRLLTISAFLLIILGLLTGSLGADISVDWKHQLIMESLILGNAIVLSVCALIWFSIRRAAIPKSELFVACLHISMTFLGFKVLRPWLEMAVLPAGGTTRHLVLFLLGGVLALWQYVILGWVCRRRWGYRFGPVGVIALEIINFLIFGLPLMIFLQMQFARIAELQAS